MARSRRKNLRIHVHLGAPVAPFELLSTAAKAGGIAWGVFHGELHGDRHVLELDCLEQLSDGRGYLHLPHAGDAVHDLTVSLGRIEQLLD